MKQDSSLWFDGGAHNRPALCWCACYISVILTKTRWMRDTWALILTQKQQKGMNYRTLCHSPVVTEHSVTLCGNSIDWLDLYWLSKKVISFLLCGWIWICLFYINATVTMWKISCFFSLLCALCAAVWPTIFSKVSQVKVGVESGHQVSELFSGNSS